MDKCREYGLELGFGIKNTNLFVSVSAPPDVATIIVLCEGDHQACPWTFSPFSLEKQRQLRTWQNGLINIMV